MKRQVGVEMVTTERNNLMKRVGKHYICRSFIQEGFLTSMGQQYVSATAWPSVTCSQPR